MTITALITGPAKQEDECAAGPLTLAQCPDGRLWATRNGESRPVRVVRLFPWSQPERFVSLRDANDEEFALIRDPATGAASNHPGVALAPESRHALDRALIDAGFVFDIVSVLEIDEEVEIRHWRVRTRQGHRQFQTRLDDWPLELPGGGLLIRDVAGDLYRLAHPKHLDRRSRRLLWALVD